MRNTPFDIEKLNFEIRENLNSLLSFGEEALENEVENTAKRIFSAGDEVKIVLVSGRSASGKTTFTKKVCKKLRELGRNAVHIALDDFWMGLEALPVDENGVYDMESIKGLDTDLANACFKEILEKGESSFPTYDFPNQKRGDTFNKIKLGEHGLIMIEGIHSLNPILTENLPQKDIMRIYIEPKESYFLNGEEVFTPYDIRLIRRMTRDELFRGWETEKTLLQWESVLRGEKVYIEPYIGLADIKVNSSVDFEPAVFKSVLLKLLSKIGENSPYFETAERIFEKLSLFEEINPENLAKESLLHEFVG